MGLSEGKRKRLIEKFETLFPNFADQVESYGSLRNDSETLLINLKNRQGVLTFSCDNTSIICNCNNYWKFQTLRSYRDDQSK